MNHFTCPSCGARYLIIPEEGSGEMKKGILSRLFRRDEDQFDMAKPWQAGIAKPAIAPQGWVKPTPQHDPVMVRFVRLPLVQAVISGFYWAWVPTGIAVVILAAAKAKIWWWLLVPIILAVSTLAISGRYWFRLYEKDRETLEFIERFTGLDLNRDGEVGKPKTTIVEIIDREKRHKYEVELPVDEDVMAEIARAILESGGRYNFSRRDMMARSSISDDAFDKLQKEFLWRKWAAYRSEGKPNSGVELLAVGRAVLRHYL